MTKTFTKPFFWENIDKIFLDLDGTLLDKHFDDYFWEQYVPEVYSKKNGVEPQQCKDLLLATYKSVENTLAWTDLDYWSERLELDLPALKKKVDHLVAIHPHVIDFFQHVKGKNKELYLVTNAHPKALKVKFNRVDIAHYFKQIICSQDVGAAKEQSEFWHKLQGIRSFDKSRTLFVDDTEKVLDSANSYGFKHLIHIAKPSSKLEARYSLTYPSVDGFKALLY